VREAVVASSNMLAQWHRMWRKERTVSQFSDFGWLNWARNIRFEVVERRGLTRFRQPTAGLTWWFDTSDCTFAIWPRLLFSYYS